MSHLRNALRAAAATVLMGSFAFAGTAAATADPTNTGNSADINTLAGSLSKGYGLNNCTAQNLTSGELAALTCGQSPDPNGPVQAKYVLFSTGDDLAGSFKASIKDDVLTACGDSGQSPTTWHQGSSTTNSGQVACGTYQNAAEIIWTTDSKNILSYIRASNTDVPAIYQWWRTNG
ncbi:serine/threonine protein kinase [Mycobacterium malmoense]|uniref:Serine/threonine protein kinase n=1 Tax=Mycobacterium malmoense TaxID=1780 RepID=A0ABX3SPM1_MYCMA|nr:serine/threonine protein kinase [Mycobacterium malmoense]OIN82840.1 serine/threonine protein kinase [Mycobacterium malmoense]ORA79268.1 serine/threonine protein kinase [Mycobacterium malmoense]QZA18206.1 serine/threonine protein kinase [Mycobacterium malmoense]UNB94980.1 serine/threonine protein kinase [Mycobacterium malmoense]